MRRRILRTAVLLGPLTLVEKGLAAARQVVLAALFGAGAAMDALVVGLSVAEMMIALLTGSFLGVFVPLYARWREKEGPAAADARGINVIAGVLVVLTAAAVGLGLGGGTLAGWVGYGFTAEQRAIAGSLMPWLAVFMWGTGAAVLATGLFHVRGRFFAPQMAQVIERVTVLVVVMALAPALGIRSAGVAFGMGGLALVGALAVAAARRRAVPRPRPSPHRPELRAYAVLFLPLMAAAIVDQAVLFTDRAMASTLPAGAVSAIYYATVIWRLPVVLLAANFCTVLFPRVSEDVAAADPGRLASSLSFGLKSMILVLIGATTLLLVLGSDLTALLFERGAFGPAATGLTSRVLMVLSLCLVVQGISAVVSMTLYALHRTGVIAAVGVGRVILNVVLNALLIGPLGAVGIALSTSLTLLVWVGMVAVPFRRALRAHGVGPVLDADFRALLLKVAVAALLTGGATAALAALPALAGATVTARAVRLLVAGGAGTALYCGLLALMRLPEAAQAARLLTVRLGWRTSP